jgi:hypothetical protein
MPPGKLLHVVGQSRNIRQSVDRVVQFAERIQEESLEPGFSRTENVDRVEIAYVKALPGSQSQTIACSKEYLGIGLLDTLDFRIHDELEKISYPSALDEVLHPSVGVGDDRQTISGLLEALQGWPG